MNFSYDYLKKKATICKQYSYFSTDITGRHAIRGSWFINNTLGNTNWLMCICIFINKKTVMINGILPYYMEMSVKTTLSNL